MSKFYLPHIDGLRAVAVIAVILYHFNENWLQNGYLGVDIFFVISGFVITGFLLRADSSNTKLFLLNFYLKRIKRLAPALIFCLFVSVVLFLTLTTRPPSEIFITAGTAVFGLSNIFLWANSFDYFSVDATLNPFTHTWSLGVEEQFYFLYPSLLLLFGLKHIKNNKNTERLLIRKMTILVFLSFLCFIFLGIYSPNANFYLLPSRIWELGIGCLGYFIFIKGLKIPNWLTYIASIALIFSLVISINHSVITTVIAVVATLCIILSQNNSFIHKILTLKVMLWLGLLSYSLYLWHWSILVLAKYTIGTTNIALLITLVIVLICAIFSYYMIEKPLRYKTFSKSSIKELKRYTSVMFIFAIIFFVSPNLRIRDNNLLPNMFNIKPVADWQVDCHGAESLAQKNNPYQECLIAKRTKEKPNVIYLIGDSHSAQFSFMLNKAMENTPYQVKFLNDEKGFPYQLIEGKETVKTLEVILDDIQEKDIVAIAFHRGHLNKERDKHIPLTQNVEENKKSKNFVNGFSKYMHKINEKGGNVFILRDTPLMSFVMPTPACNLQINLFGTSSCQVSLKQDLHTRKRQDMAYNMLIKQYPKTCDWNPLPPLYKDKTYIDVVDDKGNYIMWDWNHITAEKSENLAFDFKTHFNNCLQNW